MTGKYQSTSPRFAIIGFTIFHYLAVPETNLVNPQTKWNSTMEMRRTPKRKINQRKEPNRIETDAGPSSIERRYSNPPNGANKDKRGSDPASGSQRLLLRLLRFGSVSSCLIGTVSSSIMAKDRDEKRWGRFSPRQKCQWKLENIWMNQPNEPNSVSQPRRSGVSQSSSTIIIRPNASKITTTQLLVLSEVSCVNTKVWTDGWISRLATG